MKDRPTKLFMILGGLFVATVLIAEVIGVKIFSLEDTLGLPKARFSLFGQDGLSFNLTAGVVPWPVIFIMTDIINEYYGVRGVRFLTLLTVTLIGFAFAIFYFAIHTSPDTAYWLGSGKELGVPDMQAAFNAVFGQGMNIIIGSLIAFVLGQLIDAFIFRKIKVITGEGSIWARATMSTVVSQFIDSIVVTYVAFTLFRGVPAAQTMSWALTAYAYKFLVAILMTPLVYLVHYLCESYLGAETARNMKIAALKDM